MDRPETIQHKSALTVRPGFHVSRNIPTEVHLGSPVDLPAIFRRAIPVQPSIGV
jgi:hypothetical protein